MAWLEQRLEQLDEDSRARSSNPLRILDSKNKDTQALLEQAPTLADALSPESRLRLRPCSRGSPPWDSLPAQSAVGAWP